MVVGTLSLKKVNGVPINDPSSLLAVSELCSSTSEVGFKDPRRFLEYSSELYSQVEEILKVWSNKVKFYSI